MLNMDISTNIMNKYASSYKVFMHATNKLIISTPFNPGLKMIYRKTRTRVEMVVPEKAFTKNLNLCFLSVKIQVILFCMLK